MGRRRTGLRIIIHGDKNASGGVTRTLSNRGAMPLDHPSWIPLYGYALTALSFLCLLKWCLPRTNPFVFLGQCVRDHAARVHTMFYVSALLAIITLDILETRYDDAITRGLHWDFTPLLFRMEGSAARMFQIFNCSALTYFLSVIYLYVFSVMGIVAVLATYQLGEKTLGRKLFWATVLNYVLILPFYVLVPVTERWAVGDGEVKLLMNQISPLLIQTLRPLSGLNNCFPSFHTSMAVTIALILSQSASKRLRRTMYVLAALVIYSTLYLGFHWILDVLAGVLFGAGCTYLASAAVDKFRLEFVLYRTR